MPRQFQSRVGVSAFVRVHGSSCGTCRGVLHCHFGRKHLDATAVVVSTCSASADCTDSVTPMCSAGACVASSCDGGFFTPDGTVHGMT